MSTEQVRCSATSTLAPLSPTDGQLCSHHTSAAALDSRWPGAPVSTRSTHLPTRTVRIAHGWERLGTPTPLQRTARLLRSGTVSATHLEASHEQQRRSIWSSSTKATRLVARRRGVARGRFVCGIPMCDKSGRPRCSGRRHLHRPPLFNPPSTIHSIPGQSSAGVVLF